MNRILNIQDWDDWFHKCAFSLCSPDSQERFNRFCRLRFHDGIISATAKKNVKRAEAKLPPIHVEGYLSSTPSSDESKMYYPALDEIDAWAVMIPPRSRNQKTRKAWLKQIPNARTDQERMAAYEGRLTQCLKTELARKYVSIHYVHKHSLDRPKKNSDGRQGMGLGIVDPEPYDDTIDSTDDADMKKIARLLVHDIKDQMDKTSRIIAACHLRGIPLNNSELLNTIGLKKTVVYQKSKDFERRLLMSAELKLGSNDKDSTRSLLSHMLRIWISDDLGDFPPEKKPWESFS